MNNKITLIVTSLLTVLFFTFHWSDDIVRGIAPGGVSGLAGVLILVLWLYGTLVLANTRLGCVITLLGSALALYAVVLHMRGAGLVGGRIADSGGMFFWVWTLIALGVTSTFCGVLSVRGLWHLRSSQSRSR